MDVYRDDCGKMERPESEKPNPGVPTVARNGVSSFTAPAPPESHDVVFLGPGAPSTAATNAVACPDPDALVPTLGSAAPPATRNAVPYADWLAAQVGVSGAAARNAVAYLDGLMPQLNSGATFAAATNVVASPGALVASSLGSAVPPATRNAVPYADWLAAQVGVSGAAARNAVAYLDGLMPQLNSGATFAAATNAVASPGALVASSLGSAVPPATRNAESYANWLAAQLRVSGAAAATPRNAVASAYPEVLTAHLGSHHGLPTVGQNAGSGAPSSAVTGVAYPGEIGAVTKTLENAASHSIDVYEGVSGFNFGHFNPTGIAAAAAGQDGGCNDSSGLPLPFADKVVDDVDWDEDQVAGADAERARAAVLGRLGLAATALAVAGITAGGAATPATALGLFAMLIAGVTLVNIRVFRA